MCISFDGQRATTAVRHKQYSSTQAQAAELVAGVLEAVFLNECVRESFERYERCYGPAVDMTPMLSHTETSPANGEDPSVTRPRAVAEDCHNDTQCIR